MPTSPHILSFGKDPTLMSSRTLLLRNAGYDVQEAFTLDKAKDLVHSDSIDVALLCHTVPERDQRLLIYLVRAKRRLMPILYIRSYDHESVPLACIAVDNAPEALLQSLKSVVQSPGASKAT
jgi:DNA-binding response OmpR family regulator